MEYISIILTVALIHFLAVVSPGPDFIMVVRNSLVYSRRSGIYSAVGLGAGILVHITYSLAGIALIISQSVLLFSFIKYLGAAYLIFVGVKALRAKRSDDLELEAGHKKTDLTALQAVRSGFITNATNPKVTLFFLSLFTLVIQPSTPFAIKLAMGIEMTLATILWFTIVALLVSHRAVRHKVANIQHYLERCMGGILILFDIKLATTHAK